jgi:hypothetical protein
MLTYDPADRIVYVHMSRDTDPYSIPLGQQPHMQPAARRMREQVDPCALEADRRAQEQ